MSAVVIACGFVGRLRRDRRDRAQQRDVWRAKAKSGRKRQTRRSGIAMTRDRLRLRTH